MCARQDSAWPVAVPFTLGYPIWLSELALPESAARAGLAVGGPGGFGLVAPSPTGGTPMISMPGSGGGLAGRGLSVRGRGEPARPG